jgi:hypothetical protein
LAFAKAVPFFCLINFFNIETVLDIVDEIHLRLEALKIIPASALPSYLANLSVRIYDLKCLTNQIHINFRHTWLNYPSLIKLSKWTERFCHYPKDVEV